MVTQQVLNGELVGNTTAATASDSGAKVKSSMNETKEMFLQLLVAEMQYQDPLEPTDNSEYVKELATFTQVETLSNVQEDVADMSAKSLVGKYVSLTDPDTGKIVEGKVDFVTENAGEQFVSVDGKTFKASAITTIHDDSYYEAVSMADTFSSLVNQMPSVRELTEADEDKWGILNEIYANMTDKQKGYISDETMDVFGKINQRMSDLLAAKAQRIAAEQETQKAAATEQTDSSSENNTEADDTGEEIGTTEA